MSNIGLMEGAFFVGRKEIVDWVNSTLEIQISKVEDTASGAIACQLLDIMHPGEVPMHKVNWGAKQNFEFVSNYKILQTCFTKLHIDKFVDVDRLISGKYMDNLEFMQWFKRFFELSMQDKGDYDCLAQRMKGKGWESIPSGSSSSGGVSKATKPSSANPASARTSSSVPVAGASRTAGGTTQKSSSARVSASAAPKVPSTTSSSHAQSKSTTALTPKENQAPKTNYNNISNNNNNNAGEDVSKFENEIANLKIVNEEQSKLCSDLRSELETAGKERDFYFEKLREIETMLQDVEDKGEGNEMSAAIFKILYATAEGFEASKEGGEGLATGEGQEDNGGDRSFVSCDTVPLGADETDTF